MSENLRIGLDFCGVLITPDRVSRPDGRIFDEPVAPESHLQPGVIDAVQTLSAKSAGAVWIVSKARTSLQGTMRAYLEAVRFFDRTGLPPDHLLFCLEREEKATRARELRLTHFVDDRLAVLDLLAEVVPHRFWFAPSLTTESAPAGITTVRSWAELLPQLTEHEEEL